MLFKLFEWFRGKVDRLLKISLPHRTKLEATKKELKDRDIELSAIKSVPEVARALFHAENKRSFSSFPTRRVKECIEFCVPTLKGELKVMNPPRNVDCDVSCNLPVIFSPDQVYKDLATFMDNLMMFVPCERWEVSGPFLNIWLKRDRWFNLSMIILNRA